MAIRQRDTARSSEGPRRIYAFVDSVVEAEPTRPHSRMSLQLDAVDATAFDRDTGAVEDRGALLLARISTTPNRLGQLFGVEAPHEGDWFDIKLDRRPLQPRAWELPLTSDYVPQQATNVVGIERLAQSSEIVARLEGACVAPNALSLESAEPLQALLSLASKNDLRITALDVGQAACVAFSRGSRPFGYFDIGAPMFFNHRSFPRHLDHKLATDGFVILSHWDFDHFALAIRYPQLKGLNWFAPKQPVGPNTAHFQKALGKRLRFIAGDVNAGGFLLKQCTGTSTRNRNSTGYAMRIDRKNAGILLPGDADYQWIPPVIARGANRIMIPHHGAAGSPRLPRMATRILWRWSPTVSRTLIDIRMKIRFRLTVELAGKFEELPRMEIHLALAAIAFFIPFDEPNRLVPVAGRCKRAKDD